MFFILEGCPGASQHSYAPCSFIHPQGCTYPHMSPILLCTSICSQRLLHVVGVVWGPLTYWTPPLHLSLYGGTSPLVYTPHSFVSFPMYWYVLGISICHMGIFPSCWCLGVLPHLLGVFGGISTWAIHMLILVHFCSSLYLTFLLWLQLLLLQLRWYLLACHYFHQ